MEATTLRFSVFSFTLYYYIFIFYLSFLLNQTEISSESHDLDMWQRVTLVWEYVSIVVHSFFFDL